MGQEIHRKGLIDKSELDGLIVKVYMGIDDEDFALSMLEKHLQMAYPDAEIIGNSAYNTHRLLVVVIRFPNHEEAIHFHLSH